MDKASRPPSSYLFTLRLWRVETENGRAEWRGKLQHVLSGESRYFKDWPALVTCLRAMLPEQSGEPRSAEAEARKEDEIT